MAKRNETAEDIMVADAVERIKLDADLQYAYDYNTDDPLTRELIEQAQQSEVPYYDRDKWDTKYNLLEPKELQTFASNIYNNYEKKPGEIALEDPWKLLYCVKGTVLYGQGDGFYGELYFNKENYYLLLAVKGTSNFGNVWSDITNVALKLGGGAIDSAFTFGEKVRELIKKFKCIPMLMITGHSLGGYLAQIITFTVTYFFKDKNGSVKSREDPSDDFGIYTMVFDSPAALEQIIKLDQRDPVRPEIFLLPIVNFIFDVNIVNSNSRMGSHLGQVVAVKSLQDSHTPSMWNRVWNAKSCHGISNFQDMNIKEFQKVEYLPDKKSMKYDSKAIPSGMFSVNKFERLHKYLFLADMSAMLANKLPQFNFSNSRIFIEDETVSIEEFIPRVHHFLSHYKDQLDSGKFDDGKQIVDLVTFNLWRVGHKDAHDLSLNEQWKRKIDQWQDGTKIGGFQSHEEMRFVGCLLHNTIPRCFHYNYEDFISLDCVVKDNYLATTKGVLVLIVKDENQIAKQLYEKSKKVKIFYLILDSADNSKMNLLKFCALNENSQKKLKNKEVKFMGNDVCALLIFGNNLVENLRILSIYSFYMESALKDEILYCEQSIASEDGKSTFKSATEFAHELSKGKLKFVLMASEAGMGKSTALKQIAKTLQNRRQNYWIVHLNLFSIQREFKVAKEKLNTKAEAMEFVRNVALADRKEDEVLKKVFDFKVEAREMVLLFDSLDEICPSHRESADILLVFLRETELQIVLTTRPHEGKNFKDAAIFKVMPITSEKKQTKFILQKCKMMGKLPHSDFASWSKKIQGSRFDDKFWSFPLILNMAVYIYDPNENLEAMSENKQKTNIFETFFHKSISNTLDIKLKLDDSMASGFYSEKFNLYNKLIEILALCTIFHAGEVTVDYKNKIEKHRDFINRFDLAKVDDCNRVAFLHRSFAEHLLAKLVIQNQQGKSHKQLSLGENQLKSILYDKELSDTRKHICTILAEKPTKLTLFLGCFINEEDNLLLSILIEEDRYELYEALKDLHSSQLNKTMRVQLHFPKFNTFPLYFALKNTRDEFVQQLIRDGAQFGAILCEEYILLLAIEKGLYKDVIDHFESLKSCINETNGATTPLAIAAKNGSREMVEFLIEKGADVNFESGFHKNSALHYAIKANRAEIVELLITKKANSAEALNWAAELNRKEIFDIIYEKYTPSEVKKERLRESHFYAVKGGHLEIIKHICDFSDADPKEVKENGDTLLHIAAAGGHFNCMDFIFKYQQPSVDIKNAAGVTPLMKACCNVDADETVKWLLDKDADVNAVENEGMSCLHFAAQYNGNEHLVNILLNAGAMINSKDKKGWTPLFYAVAEGLDGRCEDMVKYLLDNSSADVNLRDNKGNTCLQISSKIGDFYTVQLLTEHLPVNCKNLKGKTPLHLAAYEGHDIIVGMLLREGTKQNLAATSGERILRYSKLINKYKHESQSKARRCIMMKISRWHYTRVRDNNLSD